MSCNVLLVGAGESARPVAENMRETFAANVTTVRGRVEGLSALRRGEFDLVLVDEAATAGDVEASNLLYELAGAAALLEVNFAISGAPRLLRQIRSALARRVHDQTLARSAVLAELRNELSAGMTGLLLEAQLALREAAPGQTQRLRLLVELAEDLRARIRPASL